MVVLDCYKIQRMQTKKQDYRQPNSATKKILICGGAGYVGGYLTDLLTQNGYLVTVYDNLTYETQYRKDVPFIFGDIRDREKLALLIPNFDVIIWLAALVGDEVCEIHSTTTTEINVSSVRWLVENYKGKLVFMSTCSVYGSNENLVDETSELNPLSHYARTKLQAEKIIAEQAKDYLVFRLGTLYGISDIYSRLRLDLVVNVLTKKATLGEHLIVFGGGQWRPLLHVKDVAEAVLFGIQNNLTGLYNLSNENCRIRDIAGEIKKVIPDMTIKYVNKKFEDLRNYRVIADKFKSHGWKPKYNLEHGIREIFQIIQEKRIKDPEHIQYSNVAYLRDKIL